MPFTIKGSPIISRAKTLPVSRPTTAREAPKDRAPTSPKNRRAGKTLK